MQGVGSLLSVVVVISCLSLGASKAFTWRFALAFGAVPAMIAFPWRLKMHETESFERVQSGRARENSVEKGPSEKGNCNGTSFGNKHYNNSESGDNYHDDVPINSKKNRSCKSSVNYAVADHSIKHHKDGPNYNKKHALQAHSLLGEYKNSVGDSVINSPVNNRKSGISTAERLYNNTEYNKYGSLEVGQPFSNSSYARSQDVQHYGADDYSNSLNLSLDTRDNSNNYQPASINVIDAVSGRTDFSGDLRDTSRMGELILAFRFYKYHMLGTALCWFLLDVDFYANGLFNHDVTATILTTSTSGPPSALTDAINAAILSAIAIPGYWLSVMYIEQIGRKNLQMLGFGMMAILFFICSLCYDWLLDPLGGWGRKYIFLLIYALTFLFR